MFSFGNGKKKNGEHKLEEGAIKIREIQRGGNE